jgi:pimeloyl-ACP methyl ester carboxylesterase
MHADGPHSTPPTADKVVRNQNLSVSLADQERERRILALSGGRQLGYAEYGDLSGFPVVAWHGAPASRLMYKAADDHAKRHGLRLISFDRPGAGLTSPTTALTLAARLDDVRALVAALELDRFAILGISGGGPYACAMAAEFGDRVTTLALVSPVGPLNDPDVAPKLSAAHRRFFLGLPKYQSLLRTGAGIARAAFLAAPRLNQRAVAFGLPRVDRAVVRQPWIRDSVLEMSREALRQDAACGVDDLTIYSQPWTIDLKRITAPTILWQGLADSIVPPISALTLGARIVGCNVRQIPGAGHFWIYERIDEVLADIRAAIVRNSMGNAAV